MALAERHPDQRLLPLSHPDLARLVCALPGFSGRAEDAPDHLLSAIVGSWIELNEGDEDSSPYEFLA
jgi:FeS assembly protein IscX